MTTVLEKLFGFDSTRHSVRDEIVGGITTFLTMAYILAVNPDLFREIEGMPYKSVFTATAMAAIVGTLIMAFFAKKPFGLAPGMGLNVFLVYTLCTKMGYSWQFAFTAILIEGILFIIFTGTKVRELIVNSIPTSLKSAIGAGIGLFIAFIGLKDGGLVTPDSDTIVRLGDFSDKATLLFVGGFLLTSTLVVLNVKGGMLIGMLVTTIAGIPLGITEFNGIVSAPASIGPTLCQFEWGSILSWDMLIVVASFLFIDMFNTTGSVIALSIKTGMVDENGKVKDINKVLLADAVATTSAACFGTSSTTTYIESASGIAAGGRTGLTAFVIALCFAVSLLFSPLFLAIPDAATSAVLAIVGTMMISSVTNINWSDYSEAIPSFLTMIVMPFTYSIANGILLGMIFYVAINALSGKLHKISIPLWILAVLFVLRYIFFI